MADQATHFADVALPDLTATAALGARIAAGFARRRGGAGGRSGRGQDHAGARHPDGLGVAEDVPSPTFTLVQSYETPRLPVSHYDLYRLKNAREMEELGLDEALDDGAVLVEWPERAPEAAAARCACMVRLGARRRRTPRASGRPARWRGCLNAHV